MHHLGAHRCRHDAENHIEHIQFPSSSRHPHHIACIIMIALTHTLKPSTGISTATLPASSVAATRGVDIIGMIVKEGFEGRWATDRERGGDVMRLFTPLCVSPVVVDIWLLSALN